MNEIITIILSLLVCAALTYTLVGFIVVRRLVDFGKKVAGEREIGPWKRRFFTALGVIASNDTPETDIDEGRDMGLYPVGGGCVRYIPKRFQWS